MIIKFSERSDFLTIPEMGFYAEVDRKTAIQQVIQDIKNCPNYTIDSDTLIHFFHKRGLNLGDLTIDEIISIIKIFIKNLQK